MAVGFPLHIQITGNNCTVFGGGEDSLRCTQDLLLFQAKVTVVSPTVCPELQAMSQAGQIRHIPRKYFRGDCSNAQLCVAATEDTALNIAISTECKAKSIPVHVTNPAAYGNFRFPHVILQDDVVISIAGDLSADRLQRLREGVHTLLAQQTEENHT